MKIVKLLLVVMLAIGAMAAGVVGNSSFFVGSPDMPICIPDQPCQYPN